MFWQRMHVGLEIDGMTWVATEAVTEAVMIEAVTEPHLLEFPTQQILPPVSDFSSSLVLGSTMSVIFCSPGCTTGTL